MNYSGLPAPAAPHASFFVGIGCLSALLAVMMGAFGAHALSQRLTLKMLDVFKTGAQYQMYHSLAILAFGLWLALQSQPVSAAPGWAFLAGIILFSGSLYALALTEISWLGAITPLGGLSFMIGWGLFAWQALRKGPP